MEGAVRMNLLNRSECLTIIAGKNTTSDGTIFHAHNEDRGSRIEGGLWFIPNNYIKANQMISFPFNIKYTFLESNCAFWFSGDKSPEKPWERLLVGINQYNVTISCNTAFSNEKKNGKHGIHSRSIRFIALSQARTAEQAVKIIAELIEKYGQALVSGQIYCIADQSEAWIVETTPNHWVAKKCSDEGIYVISNRFTISSDFDLNGSRKTKKKNSNCIKFINKRSFDNKKKVLNPNNSILDFKKTFS